MHFIFLLFDNKFQGPKLSSSIGNNLLDRKIELQRGGGFHVLKIQSFQLSVFYVTTLGREYGYLTRYEI